MSFFDEIDEPTTTRTRRPAGPGGRRPPTDQQAIAVRRAIAGGAILVLLILIILGVHSCQQSAHESALKDYNNRVGSLVQSSDGTGSQLFTLLSGSGSGNAQGLTNQINQARMDADRQLSRAQALDVPGEVQGAQGNLLLSLTMRRDGIADIAFQVPKALGPSTSGDAVQHIAGDMALFYASDAVYKKYAATKLAAALHGAGIPVGPNGQTIDGGQFLPDLGWLSPEFISSKLTNGAPAPATAASKPIKPGTHGHTLNSVTVGGTTLQTGSSNAIPRSPAPTFTLNISNGGQNSESGVVLKVTVSGTTVSGQTTLPSTAAGQSTSGDVKLGSAPPAGQATVTATVEPVPGEANKNNNTLSFPVTFQ